MDVLLSEHAYLYENACEVEYFVENKITDAGKNLIEKAKGLIEKVRKIISDLWNKLVDWVTTKVTEIKKKFGAKFSKKEIEHKEDELKDEGKLEVVALGGSVKQLNGSKAPLALEDKSASGSVAWVLDIDLTNITTDGYIIDIKDSDKAYEALGQYYNDKKNSTSPKEFDDKIKFAKSIIFASNEIDKQIRIAQKSADETLNKMANSMKINNFKNNNNHPDEMNELNTEVMENLKKCLNNNTYVCKDKIKIWTEAVSESVKMIVRIANAKTAA